MSTEAVPREQAMVRRVVSRHESMAVSLDSGDSPVSSDDEEAGSKPDLRVSRHDTDVRLYVRGDGDTNQIENMDTTELVSSRSHQDFEAEKRIEADADGAGADADADNRSEDKTPYTLLEKHEKVMIVVLISIIGMLSAVAAPIYFPILPLMQEKFHIGTELANMSVVMYLIFQGLAPTVMANFADKYGRRPVICVCLMIYIGANLGLALADAYWLILFFRCFQAGGIAPVISINSGVTGDITQRKERGSYVGAVQGITLVGQGFGALVGALWASSTFGWRSIFWFLFIMSSVTLIVALLVLPETKRSMVGNISVRPQKAINRAPLIYLPFFQRKLAYNQVDSLVAPQSNFDLLAAFKIMLLPEVACALLPSSFVFATWTMALTSYTTILTDAYGYSTLHVGLLYLPMGLGALSGSMCCGRILDAIYRWEYGKYESKYADVDPASRPRFNIFKARLQLFIIPSLIMAAFTTTFGWLLDEHKAIAGTAVSSFFMSFVAIFPVTMCTTILIDTFPAQTSTATSAVNFSRCIASAVGVAVLSKMESSMTIGGCYTFLSALCIFGNVFIYLVVAKGRTWSENRAK